MDAMQLPESSVTRGPSRVVGICLRGTMATMGFLAATTPAKTLIDYFLPMPFSKPLANGAWGASGVQPRDFDNGIEDKTGKSYSYWDGRILRAADGKYHMYASRWNQSAGHNGWFGSSCVHTVSETIIGPYVDKGLCYTDANGQGHNVMVDRMNDGTYFVLVSETRRPATVYTSKSLDGPWAKLGTMSFEKNGFNVDVANGGELHSNTTLLQRPDGSFLCTARHGIIALSTTGILGPYKVQSNSVYPNIAGLNNGNAEDPVIWASGGKYHITVNWWDAKQARHLMSDDGIRNWKDMGLAYTPSRDFIKYTNGTVNRWTKIERPQVYLENGHVTHFTFAVIDVEKDKDVGNDSHNSKVIVVPFDGVQFDKDHGWVPPASVSPSNGSIPYGRHSVHRLGTEFVLDYAGYGTGAAEFSVYDLAGAKVAHKVVDLGSGTTGSFAWSQLGALPTGTYLTKVEIDGTMREGTSFTKL
jgi:hypothetical protein